MCNKSTLVENGECGDKSCSEKNCKYCGLINGIDKCLVCNENYSLLIHKDEYKCVKQKEST